MDVERNRGILKWVLIGICAVFLVVMLILPLVYIVVTALRICDFSLYFTGNYTGAECSGNG